MRADFFAAVADGTGFDPDQPGRRFHAILLDVDHSPRQVLHPAHAPFYTEDGLRRLADLLHPDGVFALWSNDPPDGDFQRVLTEVFPTSRPTSSASPTRCRAGSPPTPSTWPVGSRGRPPPLTGTDRGARQEWRRPDRERRRGRRAAGVGRATGGQMRAMLWVVGVVAGVLILLGLLLEAVRWLVIIGVVAAVVFVVLAYLRGRRALRSERSGRR